MRNQRNLERIRVVLRVIIGFFFVHNSRVTFFGHFGQCHFGVFFTSFIFFDIETQTFPFLFGYLLVKNVHIHGLVLCQFGSLFLRVVYVQGVFFMRLIARVFELLVEIVPLDFQRSITRGKSHIQLRIQSLELLNALDHFLAPFAEGSDLFIQFDDKDFDPPLFAPQVVEIHLIRNTFLFL